MKYGIPIPEQFSDMTVKQLLEDCFLIPRKTRHFLRIKKKVRVNGQAVTWQSPVRSGDQIEISFDPEDYPEKEIPMGQAGLVQVLYEDEHLIIVNKPEGMKTHGNEPHELALLNHVSAYVGKTCYVVHRLDKETSGALVFAKNPFVLPILNRLLENRQIKREYWALCQGNILSKKMIITEPIGRDRHDRRKRRVDKKNGQFARTTVRLLKKLKTASLVACQLDTGRTHQIRVHLAYRDYPILGDPLYSSPSAPRLMLHAHRLTLLHPFTRETIQVEAPSESFESLLHQQNLPSNSKIQDR
ncbi:RluA family pseudouridine synthase [Streptococcus sp. DD13]|uniref:RluA family pseudouridine synthase n=1 Tax=Streptococcus sp. DD13 TaxID=1777881 RepID=UPI00079638F8|nr:RluA family pseudouridine synthase [Streptococcus sp. DD13]KXT77705.1 ribosomal large subunit pseudouridine synthase D-like protein [Streptococcus sp. DD13]